MAVAQPANLKSYCEGVAVRARRASTQLAALRGQQKDDWLRDSAARLVSQQDPILAANQQDLAAADQYGLTPAQVDRLRLNPQRLQAIADGLLQIAGLPDPIGEVMESTVRPNGLSISKVRVPLGVVFFIYESRPNVTADAAAICVKSGNAVILRGGKEAAHSSRAIVDQLVAAARQHQVPADAVQLVSTSDREAVGHFLQMDQWIDVAIPRGGEGLIRRVAQEARMPVIKHFDGNCHVYVDQYADPEMAVAITVNAKCQRLGVCNACESLLVHRAIADQWLPRIAEQLRLHSVEMRGDEATCRRLPDAIPASEDDFGREYLDAIISIKVVDSLDQAIQHINHYGSGHTDAIVTDHLPSARRFASEVDSAAVMVNASTRFNDGFEFGLGAEIGISTDKFHARGPCGLKELTSYKYVVYGDGQLRG